MSIRWQFYPKQPTVASVIALSHGLSRACGQESAFETYRYHQTSKQYFLNGAGFLFSISIIQRCSRFKGVLN